MKLDEEFNTEKLLILSLIGVGTILKIEDDTTKMGIYELIECVEKCYKESDCRKFRVFDKLIALASTYAKNKHNAPILPTKGWCYRG